MSDNIVDFPLSDRSIDGEDIELLSAGAERPESGTASVSPLTQGGGGGKQRGAGLGPRLKPEHPWRTAAVIALDRRTWDRAIGAEYATVASEGFKPHPAAQAVIEELAGIGWHCLDGLTAA